MAVAVAAPSEIGASPGGGPVITFFGAVSPQGIPLQCGDQSPDRVPICQLASSSNFFFVVEGRPGTSMSPVGIETFNSDGLPDLQVQVDRALGDGSIAVCDEEGGVAPISPPDLDFSDPDPVNDLACRFTTEVCTLSPTGEPRFLVPTSTVQFCVLVPSQIAFADGETRISGRLRDESGMVTTEARQVILRAGGAVLTPTRTIAGLPTPTPEPGITLAEVIAAIFSGALGADVNGDGRVAAADITALLLEE